MNLDRREFLGGAAGGALALTLPGEALSDALAAPSALSNRAARALRSAVKGRVIFPRSPGYSRARLVYNLRYDGARPEAVVQVENTADVAAVVKWANRFDVRIVARSGGHSYAGYSTLSNGVVVDLSKLGGVRVSNGKARVGAGVQLIDLQRSLTKRGLSVPSGSCPSVGVAGLTLGGGHGYLTRRRGLTIDTLLSAKMVLADGSTVTASADENPDLFWAIRGGGCNFGVVTEFTFQAHPLETIVGGPTFWALGRLGPGVSTGRAQDAVAAAGNAGTIAVLPYTGLTPEVAGGI